MLNWLSGQGGSVEDLIANKKYDKAIEAIEDLLKKRPNNVRLRLQMGDVLAMAKRTESAVKVMLELAEEFASEGFIPKAIAVLKKIQRIDPNRAEVDEKLTDLIQQRTDTIPVRTASLPPVQMEEPRDVSEEAKAEVEPVPSPAAEEAPIRSPLFSDFSREELLAVIRGLNLLTYEPGEIIMTEGEPGSSLLILTTGMVRAFAVNAFGTNIQIRTMEEGEFFGEISLLTGKPRTATITAAAPCELLELDKKALDEIAKDHPHVMEVVQEFHDQRSGSTDEMMARSS
jgi:cAMP-dependent protein kinase regulator